MPSKSDLIPHVIAAMAYVAHGFELALDLEDSFGDPENHEVLLEQLDCAGHHLADAIWALHPKWRDLDRRAAEAKALEVFREHRPDIDPHSSGVDGMVDALAEGIAAATGGAISARLFGPQRRYRDLAVELDFTIDHLENAQYLVDPDSFRVCVDLGTPTERVRLASRIEVIELELEESREYVRARRDNATPG